VLGNAAAVPALQCCGGSFQHAFVCQRSWLCLCALASLGSWTTSLQIAGRPQVERAAQRAARPHSASSAQAMAGRTGGPAGSVSALAASPGAAAHAVTAGWSAPLPAAGWSAPAALEGAGPPAAPAPAAPAPPGTRATRITPTSTARRTLAEVNARAPTYTGMHLHCCNWQGTHSNVVREVYTPA